MDKNFKLGKEIHIKMYNVNFRNKNPISVLIPVYIQNQISRFKNFYNSILM